MIDTPQARIAAKRRIDEFLADEAVVGALEFLQQKYVGEFKSAKKAEDLWRAQARMNAIDELTDALQTVRDNGEAEEIKQQRAEEKAQREKGLLQT